MKRGTSARHIPCPDARNALGRGEKHAWHCYCKIKKSRITYLTKSTRTDGERYEEISLSAGKRKDVASLSRGRFIYLPCMAMEIILMPGVMS